MKSWILAVAVALMASLQVQIVASGTNTSNVIDSSKIANTNATSNVIDASKFPTEPTTLVLHCHGAVAGEATEGRLLAVFVHSLEGTRYVMVVEAKDQTKVRAGRVLVEYVRYSPKGSRLQMGKLVFLEQLPERTPLSATAGVLSERASADGSWARYWSDGYPDKK